MNSRPKQTDQHRDMILALAKEGLNSRQIASRIGVESRSVRHVLERERIRETTAPLIDPSTLSMTAQKKFDLALKQAVNKLKPEVHAQVHRESLQWLQRMLDQHNENAKHYELVLKRRTGIMSKAEYRSILSCLHPDRVQDEALKRRFEHAFNVFTKLEKAVLAEADSPTPPSGLPKTVEELLKRRADYQAEQRARRAAAVDAQVARR
jgi:hypothetical protein